jgi:hypothetical protein
MEPLPPLAGSDRVAGDSATAQPVPVPVAVPDKVTEINVPPPAELVRDRLAV